MEAGCALMTTGTRTTRIRRIKADFKSVKIRSIRVARVPIVTGLVMQRKTYARTTINLPLCILPSFKMRIV